MSDPDSSTLVRRARGGDLPAQEALIQAYQRRIAAFVFSMLGHPDAVEDLTQTVFIRMALGLSRLREPAQFEAWLFRIARNAIRDHLRREKWRRWMMTLLPSHEEIPHPRSEPGSGGLEWLHRALRALPLKQRELIALVQDGDCSYEELARVTGSSVSSVKARLFRARETLKEWRRRES